MVEEYTSEAMTNEVDTESDWEESEEVPGMNVNGQAEKEEEKNKDEDEEDDECLLDTSTVSIDMDATVQSCRNKDSSKEIIEPDPEM